MSEASKSGASEASEPVGLDLLQSQIKQLEGMTDSDTGLDVSVAIGLLKNLKAMAEQKERQAGVDLAHKVGIGVLLGCGHMQDLGSVRQIFIDTALNSRAGLVAFPLALEVYDKEVQDFIAAIEQRVGS